MSVPAGWYPDPAPGSSLQRFWDGVAWTDRTRAVEEVSQAAESGPEASDADPLPSAVSEESVGEPRGRERRRRRRGTEKSPAAGDPAPEPKVSRSERRLARSMRVLEDRRSVPALRQVTRLLGDLLAATVPAVLLATAVAGWLGLPPAGLALLLVGPALMLIRVAAAAASASAPGELVSASRAVIAVSGRVVDVPAAVRMSLPTSALLALGAIVPAALLLLPLELLPVFFGGDGRQTLSDRLSGVQLVRR